MDDFSYDNILKHAYELEGLIHVARREGSDRQLLLKMMREKVAALQADLATVEFETKEEEEATGTVVQPVVEENVPAETPESTTVEEAAEEEEPQEDAPMLTENDDDGSSRHDSMDEPATEMTFDYVEPQKIVPTTEIEPAEEKGSAEEEESVTPESKPAETEPMENATDYDDKNVTIDTLLQRNISRDLRKAFTINDRYRFRRELFGNSDIEMNDALNLVDAMQSYAEAEEYFYDMLNWDKESPEVSEFMAIIRNHFHSR